MLDPNTLYTAADLAELKIVPVGTAANWRSAGKGPPYKKLGKRVVYLGADLLDWIEAQTVRPTAA